MKTTATENNNALDYAFFEKLHHQFWLMLFEIAHRKIGDQAAAYDLVQELFIELWEKRADYLKTEKTAAWFKKRLWYKLLVYFREQRFQARHLEDFRQFVEEEQLDAPPPDPTILREELEVRQALLEVIQMGISEMPDRMREIFLLNKEKRYSVEKIAELLDLSPQTVRNQLHRAMRRLRNAAAPYHASALDVLFAIWILTR